MTISIVDVGDMSVGISELVVLEAKLDQNFQEILEEQKTTQEFKEKLKALVQEYFEPEVRYVAIADTDNPQEEY